MVDNYSQELKVKVFPINAGKPVCVLNDIDAKELGLFVGDRVELENISSKKKVVAVADITLCAVREDNIGLYETVALNLGVKSNQLIKVTPTAPLKSVDFIKKKMNCEKLSEDEIKEIVSDITNDRLSDIEGSAFMSAVYMAGLDIDETSALTKALIADGKTISFAKGPIVDKHSVGGVNGRATMIIVPIIASAGLFIPKTSSRSITSASGTADAMEVLAPVDLPIEKIKSITAKIGGVISWGGSVDLAPADDKIIRIRHPLSLDPEGMLVASVLAKKACVGSKFVVIDIPVGKYAKIKDKSKALSIAKKMVQVGKEVGMEVEAIITDGETPGGNAFGSALEAKCALEILEGKRFDNLAKKSCEIAGALLELAGVARQGKGYGEALEILKSGKAAKKMIEIILAQGGKITSSTQIILSPLNKQIFSNESGVIQIANIMMLTKIARLAGAPANQKAGVMINKTVGERIEKGELLFTIYAENEIKLKNAFDYTKENNPFSIKK